MKSLVVYYSHKGSNKYLANRIRHSINCDIEQIKPKLNYHLLFLININFGNKLLSSNLNEYDQIILCGPIWMGKFIPPLKTFVTKNFDKIKKLIFVSCCGSTFEKKDEKFGHNLVFKEVKHILEEKLYFCEAFPITLVLPHEQKNDPNAFMKTHLSDENFKGEILEIFENFINKIK